MPLNLKSLIGKLNGPTRRAMEAAAGLCMSRTHYDIEIEHYLLKLLDSPDTDVPLILKQYGIDQSRLQAELTRSLDHLKTGNARSPAFSPMLLKMFSEAWSIGSIDYDAAEIRTGFTLLALLSNDELARATRDISKELQKIPVEGLRQDFSAIVSFSGEEQASLKQPVKGDSAGAASTANAEGGPKVPTKTPHLDQYTVNLTANAKAGKIDTVLGRDSEIRQVVDILMRRRQNNPILTGEAGVGKTAVVEGFALRIADGDVPPPL
ncbi:MAG: type VI secretion system ATPase TssH, partial [Terriglobus roseus]|nr:type VI secretion system ATPase TssH [Terriglobus roseus]